MFRLDTSLFVCRARPRNPLVAPPVAPLTRCCVLTAGPTERRIALYSDAIKMYTYRPPRILKLHCGVAGVWFACARAIRGVPNCPCMFRLRPGPPPPPWPQVNAVYRTEWDWSRKLWAQGCTAYEIYDLIVFSTPITLDYCLGPMWATTQDMSKLRDVFRQHG